MTPGTSLPARRAAARRPAPAAVQGTAAFAKFVAVLQAVADAAPPLDMRGLIERVALPRATVYRIVAGLQREGLVRVDLRGCFALGSRLIALASRSWDTFDLRVVAAESLLALRDKTGETVHLAVPSESEMVYIDKLESPQTVRMTSRIGTRVLLHASSVGKAYLSRLPKEELAPLLENVTFVRRTPNTIVRRKDLLAALADARRLGYATDKEETEPEILCLGAAICDESGHPIGGISVSIPKYRFDRNAQRRYPAFVVACAKEISASVAAAALKP
ncbi:MAG: IclR family transcriptional regulator [Burkholderiales bacterium]